MFLEQCVEVTTDSWLHLGIAFRAYASNKTPETVTCWSRCRTESHAVNVPRSQNTTHPHTTQLPIPRFFHSSLTFPLLRYAPPHVGEPLNTTCSSANAFCSSLVKIGRVAQSTGSSPFGFATIRLKCACTLTSCVVRTGLGQASEMVRMTPRTPAAIFIVSKREWSSSNVTRALTFHR